MRKYRVLCIGEILWDVIEGEKHLGGAPFNLGCFVHYLGHEGVMLSRVGTDGLGEEILERFSLKLVCLTCGERGCSLDDGRQHVYSPGYRVKVEDTVGSGDAFTAALVTRYLAGTPLEEIADFSNLVGACVASRRGAVPQVTEEALEEFRARSVLGRTGTEGA